MSTLSLQERVDIAAQKGANISLEDWTGEEGEAELSNFLDSLDVPRQSNDDD